MPAGLKIKSICFHWRVLITKNLGPLEVFRSRRYTLYFGGQLISQTGTWMQQVALAWFVYDLTHSPFLLAAVGVATQIPSLVLMPVAGVMADSYNRHRILLLTQIFALVQAGLLAAIVFSGSPQMWQIFVLAALSGILVAFEMPVRAAFLVNIIDNKDDLAKAISMNSALFNVTRLGGPALAGYLMLKFSVGICFLLNSLSYLAVILALLLIKGNFEPDKKMSIKAEGIGKLKEGFEYTINNKPVRAIILFMAAFCMGGFVYITLMPVLVKELHGDPSTLGMLMSISALGSCVGALALGFRKSILGLGKWVIVSSIMFSVLLIVFSFCRTLEQYTPLMVLMGGSMMFMMSACSTILQSIIDEEKRGRVMSLFTMAFMGSAPLGGLLAGACAGHFGYHVTILGAGIYCLLVSLIFAFRVPELRQEAAPVSKEIGLLQAEEELDILS